MKYNLTIALFLGAINIQDVNSLKLGKHHRKHHGGPQKDADEKGPSEKPTYEPIHGENIWYMNPDKFHADTKKEWEKYYVPAADISS